MVYQPKRDSKGRFVKGHSGNPGGVPREVINAIRFARSQTGPAIRVAVNIMMDKTEAARDRLKAVEIVLDRGLGKPPQLSYAVNVDDRTEEAKSVARLAREVLAVVNDNQDAITIEMERVMEGEDDGS